MKIKITHIPPEKTIEFHKGYPNPKPELNPKAVLFSIGDGPPNCLHDTNSAIVEVDENGDPLMWIGNYYDATFALKVCRHLQDHGLNVVCILSREGFVRQISDDTPITPTPSID